MAVLLVRMRVSVSVKVNIREYSSGNPRLFDVEENNLGSERTNCILADLMSIQRSVLMLLLTTARQLLLRLILLKHG